MDVGLDGIVGYMLFFAVAVAVALIESKTCIWISVSVAVLDWGRIW